MNAVKNSEVYDKSASVIKRNSGLFSIPLIVLLFNQSFADGKFPAILKAANATPIYKCVSKGVPQNYRRVS